MVLCQKVDNESFSKLNFPNIFPPWWEFVILGAFWVTSGYVDNYDDDDDDDDNDDDDNDESC